MKHQMHRAAALMAVATLTACGGGGDGDSAGNLQGLWQDSTSGTLITAEGEIWSVESNSTTLSTTSTLSLTAGTVSVSGNAFTGSITQYGSTNVTGSIAGTFVAKSSLAGTVTASGQQGNVSMTYVTAYDTPAALSTVAGTWRNTSTGRTVVIDANGAMTMTFSTSTCRFTGTVQPDGGGKAFYRLTGTYSTGCAQPGASARGVLMGGGTGLLGAAVFGEGGGTAFYVVRG